MRLLELNEEVWVKLSLVESLSFSKEIDRNVGHAKKVGFLDDCSGEGCVLKGCALQVGMNQFRFTEVGEMQLGF